MSILPDDVMQKVVETFNTKESRAVALELLTAWDRMPSWKERGEVGKRHGRSDKTVQKIVSQLQEMELFTDKEGSIPLYRISLKGKLTVPEAVEPPKTRATGIVGTEKQALTPAGFPWDDEAEGESEDESEPASDPSEGRMELLEAKFFRMEAEIGKMRENFEAVVPVIKGLSAKVTDNPSSVETSTPTDTPKMAESSQLNPFAGMTGEQVYEIYLNQPEAFAKLLGTPIPADAIAEGSMSALPATVRRMIVELTAYTQISYEKVVNDGAFDGSLSDFLNQCAYKYFADRGIVLEWRRTPTYPAYPRRAA